jgi:hypothetical protein
VKTILKSDEVQFVIVPVFSIMHMKREVDKLEKFAEVIRSLVFLNCAGAYDLTEFWFYQQTQECSAYLIDYHRPLNHMNLIDPLRKIFVLDDGCLSFKECPNEDDLRIYQELHENPSEHSGSQSQSDEPDEEDSNSSQELAQDVGSENEEELK